MDLGSGSKLTNFVTYPPGPLSTRTCRFENVSVSVAGSTLRSIRLIDRLTVPTGEGSPGPLVKAYCLPSGEIAGTSAATWAPSPTTFAGTRRLLTSSILQACWLSPPQKLFWLRMTYLPSGVKVANEIPRESPPSPGGDPVIWLAAPLESTL